MRVDVPMNVLKALSLLTSKDDSRAALQCVCVRKHDDETVEIAATDSYTLGSIHVAASEFNIIETDDELLIPAELIKRIGSTKAETATIMTDGCDVTIEVLGCTYTSPDQIQRTKYPNYKQLIDDDIVAESPELDPKKVEVMMEVCKLINGKSDVGVNVRVNGIYKPVYFEIPTMRFIGLIMPVR